MQRSSKANHCPGWKRSLTYTLALGLGLGLAPHASQVLAGTISVYNCNDSGGGSLRSVVAAANSGDTINLSGLSCSPINLTSGEIAIAVNSLTIMGKANPDPSGVYPPKPEISGRGLSRIFNHTGRGRLYLQYLVLRDGYNHNVSAYGGCVVSYSNVTLTGTYIRNCRAVANGGKAEGGGIYAMEEINLDGGSVIDGNTAKSGNHAQGGGLRAGYGLVVSGRSTVSNNSAINDGYGQALGGGLYVGEGIRGAASPAELIVRSNTALGPTAKGGGVYCIGRMDVRHMTVTDNQLVGESGEGGGIYAAGRLLLAASNVLGNHAVGDGGGIYAEGSSTIETSTIANNTADGGVAGARLYGWAQDPVTIDQSTISGNESGSSGTGAGLYLLGTTVIKNSTITDNVAVNLSDNLYGAGISLDSGVQLTLSSTIVSENWLWSLAGGSLIPWVDDIGKASGAGVVYDIDGSNNMVGNSTITTPSDTNTQPAKLEALADNAGPTLTHMPKPDSPAVDHGKANGFATDQRGYARVIGFVADIGAVEYDDDRIFYNGFQ